LLAERELARCAGQAEAPITENFDKAPLKFREELLLGKLCEGLS
jgi:hypothetical protein